MLLSYYTVLFAFGLTVYGRALSLECSSCSGVQDMQECNTRRSCSDGQVCYTKREYSEKVQFELGCVDKQHCGEYAKIPNGTMGINTAGGQTQYCYECCSTKNCNKNLCNHAHHSYCVDDKSFDCALLNSMLSLCKNIVKAKLICPKYCNLCHVVDGNWSPWTSWSGCDVTCENGTRSRARTCTNPAPQYGGIDCNGDSIEFKVCHMQLCPVHGGWSEWVEWSSCPVTCGVGMQSRTRTCTNPVPDRFGDHCFGQSLEDRLCNPGECTSFTDCYGILKKHKNAESGVYSVTLWRSKQRIQVYCDMNTDNGGWTIFQYRFNGSVDFYRNFTEYENGFGDFETEFWLGLKSVQEMASQGKTELRLDLTAADGTTAYETFQNFYLDEGSNYTLHIDPGRGTAGDNSGLSYNNGQHFTTYDADRDGRPSGNCAVMRLGGWWYSNCVYANLNGEYVTPGTLRPVNARSGMVYYSFQHDKSLKAVKMMFRRV